MRRRASACCWLRTQDRRIGELRSRDGGEDIGGLSLDLSSVGNTDWKGEIGIITWKNVTGGITSYISPFFSIMAEGRV
ncbi:hypothetical protein SBA5_200048 [Candidatus Sulfotelmatomonas gaucii]|uniref:Uncharacterized protein n=1 Tax=Candidatus Sulfuritelmatomonas gaucii TaxID=2043161 RepID=A0A2N9L782_9BACT|nr:hypothetical protein SBA5_200048 [Candidatus Sulfotelmatomonas gaucii]